METNPGCRSEKQNQEAETEFCTLLITLTRYHLRFVRRRPTRVWSQKPAIHNKKKSVPREQVWISGGCTGSPPPGSGGGGDHPPPAKGARTNLAGTRDTQMIKGTLSQKTFLYIFLTYFCPKKKCPAWRFWPFLSTKIFGPGAGPKISQLERATV